MGDHAFYFKTYDFQKEHPYTIIFTGACTQMSHDVHIEYTGADVETTSSIPKEWLNDLKEKLNEDYGYGPFDKSKIDKIFNKSNSYVF